MYRNNGEHKGADSKDSVQLEVKEPRLRIA